jgi:hypothetical protein
VSIETPKAFALIALAVVTGSYLVDFDTFKNMLMVVQTRRRLRG